MNHKTLHPHILDCLTIFHKEDFPLNQTQDYIIQSLELHLFFARIMKEHALFIRGLLDPSEEPLITTADQFASEFKRLLEASAKANNQMIQSCDSDAHSLTQKLRDFKQAGVEGIEACKIRALILPLLADHVLREANHYIRILEDTS